MISNGFDIFCLAESWLSFSNDFMAMKLRLHFAVAYLVLTFKSFKSMHGIPNVNVSLSFFFF